MRTVWILVGTRPEGIKLCPLVLELQRRKNFSVRVISTGQHRELLQGVFRNFGVIPDVDFGIMLPGQSPGAATGKMLAELDALLEKENDLPDWILVQGDTATAFAGALTGFYRHIPVGHIEAGLRTKSLQNPFPEEMHRRGISKLAALHFAPTREAMENLLREGVPADSVFVTGNTVADALRFSLQKTIPEPWSFPKGGRVILFTAHRRENFGEPMRRLFWALRDILEEFPDVTAVYPVHPNPQVKKEAELFFGNEKRVWLIAPPDVFSFHRLLSHCDLILTDSGGIQEEATALGIPTLVMREETERMEGVKAGCLKLVGTDRKNILLEAEKLLAENADFYRKTATPNEVFGDGKASVRIADILERF